MFCMKNINRIKGRFLVTGFFVVSVLFSFENRCLGETNKSDSGWALDAVVAASNSLKDIERVYPDGGDAVINGMVSLGEARMDALQYAEAEKDYLRAIDLHKSVFKNISGEFRHDLVLHIKLLSGLADAQLQQNKLEKATHNYRRGLFAAKLGISSTTPAVKHLRTGKVLTIARRSTREAGESLFEQLLTASEKASGFIHDDIAMILDQWIEFRALTECITDCEDLAIRLVDVLQRVHGSDHPEVAEALNRQASIIYEKGNSRGKGKGEGKRALPLLREAYKIRLNAFGESHPLTQLSEQNLDKLLRKLYLKRQL